MQKALVPVPSEDGVSKGTVQRIVRDMAMDQHASPLLQVRRLGGAVNALDSRLNWQDDWVASAVTGLHSCSCAFRRPKSPTTPKSWWTYCWTTPTRVQPFLDPLRRTVDRAFSSVPLAPFATRRWFQKKAAHRRLRQRSCCIRWAAMCWRRCWRCAYNRTGLYPRHAAVRTNANKQTRARACIASGWS